MIFLAGESKSSGAISGPQCRSNLLVGENLSGALGQCMTQWSSTLGEAALDRKLFCSCLPEPKPVESRHLLTLWPEVSLAAVYLRTPGNL